MASEKAPITPGNSLPLRNIPAGTIIHNLEPRPGENQLGHSHDDDRPGAGGQINRSAGCFAAIMSKDSQWATIKLNSTEIKRFPLDCWAVVGQVNDMPFHLMVELCRIGWQREFLGAR